MDDARFYADAPADVIDTGSERLPCRRVGSGPPLLLVHGFPLSGFTWRKVLPALAAHRTCFVRVLKYAETCACPSVSLDMVGAEGPSRVELRMSLVHERGHRWPRGSPVSEASRYSNVRAAAPGSHSAWRVSPTITLRRSRSEIRFGTAISPLATSAKSHTACKGTVEPMNTAATQSQR